MDIRTFFVTQDREKSTDSVEGAAAQECTDSVIKFVHASPPQPSTAVLAYGAVHIVAARLGCERVMVGTMWVFSHPYCINSLRNTTLTLLRVGLWQGKLLGSYCMLGIKVMSLSSLNPLITNDAIWCRLTLAAC